jgi:hypothetical protein
MTDREALLEESNYVISLGRVSLHDEEDTNMWVLKIYMYGAGPELCKELNDGDIIYYFKIPNVRCPPDVSKNGRSFDIIPENLIVVWDGDGVFHVAPPGCFEEDLETSVRLANTLIEVEYGEIFDLPPLESESERIKRYDTYHEFVAGANAETAKVQAEFFRVLVGA